MTRRDTEHFGLERHAKRSGDLPTVQLAFSTHYIKVSSNSDALLARFVPNVESMLSLQPRGIEAGAFCITEAAGRFTLHEEGSSDEESLNDLGSMSRELHHQVIKRFIQVRPDLLWIHAGAVSFAGRAIVLAGPSGEGKSTIVEALLDWGCSYLSDEIAPIDPVDGTVLPFPISPWKRIAIQDYLPAERFHELTKVRVPIQPRSVGQAPAPLAQVYLLRHQRAPFATRLDGCSPAVAVIELMKNSFNMEDSRAVEIERLHKLTSSIDARYLNYVDATEAASRIILALSLTTSSASDNR